MDSEEKRAFTLKHLRDIADRIEEGDLDPVDISWVRDHEEVTDKWGRLFSYKPVNTKFIITFYRRKNG